MYDAIGTARSSRPPRGKVMFGPARLVLHERPQSDRTLEIFGDAWVAVILREEQADWVRVEIPSDGGATITGWMPLRHLSPDRPPSEDSGVLASSDKQQARPGIRGGARLAAGAEVFAAPGRGKWATVDAPDGFEVLLESADAEWVLIEHAPNARVVLWSADEDGRRTARAWARRRDVIDFAPGSGP